MSELSEFITTANNLLSALEAYMNNGGGMATQEEIKNAISEGLEEFTETLAKRYLSGAKLNFSVDEDGNVVVGGGADAELPEDDPETAFDENLAARAGGAKAVAASLEEIVNNRFNWFAASATIPQAAA